MKDLRFTDENIARYFSGELDEKTIEIMEKDMLNDDEKDRQMRDFARLWEKSAELSKYDKMNVESDWQKVRARMGLSTTSKRIPFGKYLLRISAIVVLAFGLAFFFNELIKQVPGSDKIDYYKFTSENGSKELKLPDQSVITLNRGSQVIYNNNFGVTNRDLILEGEAFFDVARNESLPFKVFAESSTIEVLGTSFNIKSSAEKVKVSVVSGKVAFYETIAKQNRIELIKDEQSEYNYASHTFAKKELLERNAMAWKTGHIVFDGEPISEALTFLENYFDKKIVVEAEEILSQTLLEAEFKSDDSLSEILDYLVLSVGQNLQVEKTENGYVVKNKSGH